MNHFNIDAVTKTSCMRFEAGTKVTARELGRISWAAAPSLEGKMEYEIKLPGFKFHRVTEDDIEIIKVNPIKSAF